MVVRISKFAIDFADDIVEIDVNPVMMGAHGGIAGDALIVRHISPAAPRHGRPKKWARSEPGVKINAFEEDRPFCDVFLNQDSEFLGRVVGFLPAHLA